SFRFDLPQRRLTPIALPLGGGSFADEIQTGFVLPMVMGSADGEMRLGPDDLTLRFKAAHGQRLLHFTGKEARMPHICDVARKETVRIGPVAPIIVRDGTFTPCSKRNPAGLGGAIAPAGVVTDSVRGIANQ